MCTHTHTHTKSTNIHTQITLIQAHPCRRQKNVRCLLEFSCSYYISACNTYIPVLLFAVGNTYLAWNISQDIFTTYSNYKDEVSNIYFSLKQLPRKMRSVALSHRRVRELYFLAGIFAATMFTYDSISGRLLGTNVSRRNPYPVAPCKQLTFPVRNTQCNTQYPYLYTFIQIVIWCAVKPQHFNGHCRIM